MLHGEECGLRFACLIEKLAKRSYGAVERLNMTDADESWAGPDANRVKIPPRSHVGFLVDVKGELDVLL